MMKDYSGNPLLTPTAFLFFNRCQELGHVLRTRNRDIEVTPKLRRDILSLLRLPNSG